MTNLKKLASETLIYGVSSIMGRFINWLMVPLYTSVFQPPNYPISEYGILTKIMGFVALFMVLLTFGTETGYFRFSSSSKEKSKEVFSTLTTCLMLSSALFVCVIILCLPYLAEMMYVSNRKYIIIALAITIGLDAYCSIPFAKLRQDERPMRFASIKLINIGINVLANVFFLLLCPYLLAKNPDSIIRHIYSQDVGIGYVFISYLIAAVVTLLLLIPELRFAKLQVNIGIFQKIFNYSIPIMIVGIASIVNINFPYMAMDKLLKGKEVLGQVGEYGAAFKMGVIMTILTQAFRYAFEPFFFKNRNIKNANTQNAIVMKFFVIIGLLTFLGVVFYIDIVALLIGKSFRTGMKIVPIVLIANILLGIYYVLSPWYKLSDKTQWGAYMAIIGSIITIALNIILVPKIGYMGAAYAFLFSALTMTVISYLLGQKHYPIPYRLKPLILYCFTAIILYIISKYITFNERWINLSFRTALLLVFVIFTVIKELNAKSIMSKHLSK